MKKQTFGAALAGLGVVAALVMINGCGGGAEKPKAPPGSSPSNPLPAEPTEAPAAEFPGMITASDINMSDAVDKAMADKGMNTYNVKCQSCHTLTDKRVVGPGWGGILKKRKPEWIMNMIMHTEAMLDNDAEAQKMLEECLVRMPNQNLSKDEAREVVEFMRTI